MTERFALYYAPATTDPLWTRAAAWLGRDPAGGVVPAAEIAGLSAEYRASITAAARRYGFHATIKAPMALAPGVTRAALECDLERFAAGMRPVPIGRLVPRVIDGFIALVPERQEAALTAFAQAVVERFDRCRAPLAAQARARRIAEGGLDERQVALLDRFGYPYVMEQFRFHMTLADRLPESECQAVLEAATDWFAPVLAEPLVLDRLALFHEAGPGAPFARLADYPFRAEASVDA